MRGKDDHGGRGYADYTDEEWGWDVGGTARDRSGELNH